MNITVCICTYKRPALLRKLLAELLQQEPSKLFTYSIVVADNDETESARPVVEAFARTSSVKMVYCVELQRSIAAVRNKCIEHSSGDAIAFIDDDEYPDPRWLSRLLKTCVDQDVAGVLGPVNPYFDKTPPAWVLKGQLFSRPEHETGYVMRWQESRTGNVLFRKKIIEGMNPPFLPEFATGGEDLDFFRRLIDCGHRFVWCSEAVVYELVPPTRWSRWFQIKRALLRGRNSFRHREGRWSRVLKSFFAVPSYTLALPFCQLKGHHIFMKYLLKMCNHLGRLLALVGVYPVKEREM